MINISIEQRLPKTELENEQLKSVFFSSSSVQSFQDENSKQIFLNRWLGQYLNLFPEWVWLALKDNNVIGYLISNPNSSSSDETFYIPAMDVFQDLYQQYPAGLHINVDSKARGLGVGEKLISALVEKCRVHHLKGVHAITSPGERNNQFYRKNHFLFEKEIPYKKHSLLFMGRLV